MKKKLTLTDIAGMDKRPRVQLINSLPGFKSVNLIGTMGEGGNTNLAIFSSVIHIGSNPPLFGFITRPVTVTRDTYENIMANGYFTINHVNPEIYKQAHQTSARYDKDTSEFSATGLTPEFIGDFAAPYVKESHVKLGLQFVEKHPIETNGTILMIGKLQEVYFPENCLLEDGFLDLEKAGTITGSALDSYYQPQKIARLSYAKPDRPLKEI